MRELEQYHRPIICTEYMARGVLAVCSIPYCRLRSATMWARSTADLSQARRSHICPGTPGNGRTFSSRPPFGSTMSFTPMARPIAKGKQRSLADYGYKSYSGKEGFGFSVTGTPATTLVDLRRVHRTNVKQPCCVIRVVFAGTQAPGCRETEIRRLPTKSLRKNQQLKGVGLDERLWIRSREMRSPIRFGLSFVSLSILGCSLTQAAELTKAKFREWESDEELKNRYIQLNLTPQLGGRILGYQLGDHLFLSANPLLRGQTPAPTRLGPTERGLIGVETSSGERRRAGTAINSGLDRQTPYSMAALRKRACWQAVAGL